MCKELSSAAKRKRSATGSSQHFAEANPATQEGKEFAQGLVDSTPEREVRAYTICIPPNSF